MPVPYKKLEYRGDGLYYRDGVPFTVRPRICKTAGPNLRQITGTGY